jgi:hypothetical protein
MITGSSITTGYASTAESWTVYYPSQISVGTSIVSPPQVITTPDTVISDYQSPSGVSCLSLLV